MKFIKHHLFLLQQLVNEARAGQPERVSGSGTTSQVPGPVPPSPVPPSPVPPSPVPPSPVPTGTTNPGTGSGSGPKSPTNPGPGPPSLVPGSGPPGPAPKSPTSPSGSGSDAVPVIPANEIDAAIQAAIGAIGAFTNTIDKTVTAVTKLTGHALDPNAPPLLKKLFHLFIKSGDKIKTSKSLFNESEQSEISSIFTKIIYDSTIKPYLEGIIRKEHKAVFENIKTKMNYFYVRFMVCYFLFLNDGRLSEYKTGQEAALEMVPKLGLDEATSEVVIALIKEITGYDVEHLKTQKGVTIDSLRATLDILSTMHKSKQVEQVETVPPISDENESTELRELRTSLAALQGTEAQLQDLKTKSAGDEAATKKLIVGSKEFMETVDALLAIMNLNKLTTIANYQDAKTAIEDIKKQRGGSASEPQSDIEQLLRQQKTQLIAICDKYIGILDKFIKDEERYQKINTDLEQSIEWWQNKTEEIKTASDKIKTASELANAVQAQTNSERVLTLQRVIEELKEEKETLETNKGVKAQLIQSLEGALDEATAKLTAEQTDANELSVSQSKQLKISKTQTKEAEQARAAAEAEAQAAQKAQAAAESQRQTSEQARAKAELNTQEAKQAQEAAERNALEAQEAKRAIVLQGVASVATAEGYKQAAIAAAAIAEQEKKTLVAEANAEKERIVAEMTKENKAAQATAAAATKEKDAAEERAAKAEQDKKTAEAEAAAATTAKNAAEAAAKEATTAKREAEAAAAKAEQDKNAAIKAAARYNSEKEAAIQKAAAAEAAKGVAIQTAAEAEATAAEASAAAAAAIIQSKNNRTFGARFVKAATTGIVNTNNYKEKVGEAEAKAAEASAAAAAATKAKDEAVAAAEAAQAEVKRLTDAIASAEAAKNTALKAAEASQREVKLLTEAIASAQEDTRKAEHKAEQQVIRLNAAVAKANKTIDLKKEATDTAIAAATKAEAAAKEGAIRAAEAETNAQVKIKAAEEKASKAQAKAAKAQANAAAAEEKTAIAIAEKDAALEAAAKAVASANKKRDAAKEATDTAIAAAKEATERADAAIAAAKEEKTRANEEVAAAQEAAQQETERANEAEGELRVYMEVIKHLLTDIKNTRTELHGKNHDDDVAINQLLNLYLRYDIETEANLKETEPGQLKQMLQSLKTKPTQYLVDELRAQSMLSINTLLDQIDDPTDQDLQIARAQLGAMESVSLKWAQPRSQTFNRLREIQELKSTLKKLEAKKEFNAIWVEVGKQLDLVSMICLRELDVGLLKQQLTERKSFIVAFENGSAQLEEMKDTKPDPFNDMLSEIQALIDNKSPNLTGELARIVGKYSTSSSSSVSKPSSGRP